MMHQLMTAEEYQRIQEIDPDGNSHAWKEVKFTQLLLSSPVFDPRLDSQWLTLSWLFVVYFGFR